MGEREKESGRVRGYGKCRAGRGAKLGRAVWLQCAHGGRKRAAWKQAGVGEMKGGRGRHGWAASGPAQDGGEKRARLIS